MNLSRLKYPALVVGVGLICGLIGDLLTYNQPPGISIPILTLALLIGLLALAAVEKTEITFTNLWLVIPLMTTAAFSAIRAEPLLRFMNIAGTVGLALLLANRLANAPLLSLSIGGYVGAWIESGIASLIAPFMLLARVSNESRQDGKSARFVIGRVAVGLVIALPFLLVFGALFSSADLVFSKWADAIIMAIQIPDIIGHAFVTALLAWFAMGGMAYALTRAQQAGFFNVRISASPDAQPQTAEAQRAPTPQAPTDALKGWLGSIETSVILYSIDTLFAIFVGIQFAALFGREAFIRSQGITYSEYARRGFFELLVVSIITLGLALTLEFFSRRETPRQRWAFMIGAGLMIGLTIIILASAYERMQLYELAYGFTRLRVYPHIFMIWLAVLFAAFLICLVAQRMTWFATALLVFAMGYVITMDILNPDAFIVEQNVQRFEAGNQEFDVEYLGSLSEDAIPYLMPLLTDYGENTRGRIGPWLKWHLAQLDRRQEKAGLGAYHWSVNQAYALLDARRAEIEKFNLDNLRYSMVQD